MLIRFTGPVMADGKPTYQDYSFYDLFYSELQLAAGEKPEVDPAVFRDKIVVVGTTAAGLHDLFTVPFAEGKMPGMQVHANIIDNLLSQRFMRPTAPAGTSWCWSSARWRSASQALRWPCGRRRPSRPWSSWRSAGCRSCCSARASGWRWRRRSWRVAFATFGGTAYQYFVEGREKRQVKQMFSRFVSRDVYDQLMADPSQRADGRRAARDVRALLGHPRLHDLHRARPARRRRRAAERVLLADGGGGVRAPRHGGQVRRRHGDGAVRRAARRPGPRGPRRAGGARHARRARRPQRALGGARGGRRSTSASASTPATWWRATSGPTRS